MGKGERFRQQAACRPRQADFPHPCAGGQVRAGFQVWQPRAAGRRADGGDGDPPQARGETAGGAAEEAVGAPSSGQRARARPGAGDEAAGAAISGAAPGRRSTRARPEGEPGGAGEAPAAAQPAGQSAGPGAEAASRAGRPEGAGEAPVGGTARTHGRRGGRSGARLEPDVPAADVGSAPDSSAAGAALAAELPGPEGAAGARAGRRRPRRRGARGDEDTAHEGARQEA